MSNDEPVNGARIAAEILKKMPAKDKLRLVKAIQEAAPDAAKKIEENLFDFDDIAELTPQGIQVLLREIDHKDLVLSLKAASPGVRNAFAANMTERKKQLVEEDFAALTHATLTEVQDAQKRIIDKVEALRASGAIRSADPRDVWV